MPQKNTLKSYAADSYYHVYCRGVNKQKIFLEGSDYAYFMQLLERYLSGHKRFNSSGDPYPDYSKLVRINAYCLMPNHVHLLIYQGREPMAIRRFMSSVLTSYSKYFNAKYKRVGSLFESRYKAKLVEDSAHLTHLSRYIHMNPRRWRGYKYSSLPGFVGRKEPPKWLDIKEVLAEFGSSAAYLQFLEEYEGRRRELELIKADLANK